MEEDMVQTFPKVINMMWNANSLFQDLNLAHYVHFL